MQREEESSLSEGLFSEEHIEVLELRGRQCPRLQCNRKDEIQQRRGRSSVKYVLGRSAEF